LADSIITSLPSQFDLTNHIPQVLTPARVPCLSSYRAVLLPNRFDGHSNVAASRFYDIL